MKENWEQCFALILKNEGGYVDNPKDPGGATNLGCTKKVWEEWVGHEVTKDVIKALMPNDVMPLYKERYWDTVKGDDLPIGVDYAVFDLAINSGPGKAAKTLQSVLGVSSDGKIGPATIAAAQAANAGEIASRICETRLAFLQGLSTWSTFGKGWGRRVAEVAQTAKNMVG
ncbi:Peptidoglycan binding domain containing protein [uncultured Caudovirales phage]|uniref:Peptidoglycan binding domain containing protein n=1 Tax=uncultured Caudovirales phage TaxID=2100421 RepID=A0A6J7WYG9_9CAUD|nr:Peptidoglycan binding domain containing protein [uncultured Caudovirales phage]